MKNGQSEVSLSLLKTTVCVVDFKIIKLNSFDSYLNFSTDIIIPSQSSRGLKNLAWKLIMTISLRH